LPLSEEQNVSARLTGQPGIVTRVQIWNTPKRSAHGIFCQ
jgi:hypothetical protein